MIETGRWERRSVGGGAAKKEGVRGRGRRGKCARVERGVGERGGGNDQTHTGCPRGEKTTSLKKLQAARRFVGNLCSSEKGESKFFPPTSTRAFFLLSMKKGGEFVSPHRTLPTASEDEGRKRKKENVSIDSFSSEKTLTCFFSKKGGARLHSQSFRAHLEKEGF